jgi:hypothetical protein
MSATAISLALHATLQGQQAQRQHVENREEFLISQYRRVSSLFCIEFSVK